jgi:hypothetical protein
MFKEAIKRKNNMTGVHQTAGKPSAETCSRDYAAYVYLVLKVHLEHPILYKLINVSGTYCRFYRGERHGPEDRENGLFMARYLRFEMSSSLYTLVLVLSLALGCWNGMKERAR